MNKTILSAILGLSLTVSSAFAASPMQVTATDGNLSYTALYTESSWMAIAVPVADLGGTVPSDLTLSAGDLDAGTTITLDGVTRQGDLVLLHVTVSRADTGRAINQTATIALNSGGQTLTTVSIPVLGAASADE
ncbi:hypothetical protein [Deinococcus aerophilus]|uniref:BACON domain-containing protein n=1 Tax=Deinococcus aerophilus TaxID=522488 RepID=A0ABQ2GR21_9DEIO|nr:hypothetical protein [Deinococcus aerophilus]GGM07631.1 hypothetical protein GCM10010841_14920 [Deinococcus aerophilus]